MSVGYTQTVITDTVDASSSKDIATDEIRYGPIAILGLYVYASTSAEWELRIGGVIVAKGKAFSSAFDGNMNKVQSIGVGAYPGELVELIITNKDTANSANVEATIYYMR